MDQIEQVKNKTDIVELISQYLPLKKAGRNYKTECPFHSEKTPSFMVSPQLQIFKCFGCGKSGDAIKFLQLHERMDFWEAVEKLALRAGIKLKRFKPDGNELIRRKIYATNQQAAEFYHFLLTRHQAGKKALEYITGRGISTGSLKTFQIGFSPLYPSALVNYLTGKKNLSPTQIIQAGLGLASNYTPGKVIDRFRGRIMFPLHDHRGNAIGFSGRVIPGLTKNEDQVGKYINTAETLAYHKGSTLYGLNLTQEAIKKSNQAIIVEGELDLISPWQKGIKNIVALKGTAFTPDQVKLIKRYAQNITLALDEDFAGSNAALGSIQLAEAEGLEITAIDLKGKFKDPDEAAQKDSKFLQTALNKAVPVWDFVIKKITQKHSLKTIAGKKRILNEALPFLTKIDNEVVKSHYLKKLSRLLKVDQESVIIEAEKISQKQSFAPVVSPPPLSTRHDRREVLESYLLGLVFSSLKPKKFLTATNKNLFKTFRWKRIFSLAQKFSQNKNFAPDKFLDFLPDELKNQFEEVFLTAPYESGDLDGEIAKTIFELEKLGLRESLIDLSVKITQAEEEKQVKKLAKWGKRFTSLTEKLVELESQE